MSWASVTLRDGRALAYEQYGDPDGVPVLNCHGGLLCRLDVEPADAAELVDALGIDRLGVMGWSAGGQYALAVAARLGARVTHTAVIAGCVPLDGRDTRKELSSLDQRLVTLSTRTPWLAARTFGLLGWSARRDPHRTTARAVDGLPAPERDAVLAAGDWFGRAMAEAMHDPRGQADDYRAFAAPWGFAPEAVAVPVTLWQGDRDRLVPAAWADALAARLPVAEVVRCPGEDHFIALTRRAEVLGRLVAAAG